MTFINIHEQRADLLPDKYDGFFRYHDSEMTLVLEDGDVESPYGHFTLREVTLESIATVPMGFGYDLVEPGWYIDVRNSDGLIWVFDYRGTGTFPEENARAAFEAAR